MDLSYGSANNGKFGLKNEAFRASLSGNVVAREENVEKSTTTQQASANPNGKAAQQQCPTPPSNVGNTRHVVGGRRAGAHKESNAPLRAWLVSAWSAHSPSFNPIPRECVGSCGKRKRVSTDTHVSREEF